MARRHVPALDGLRSLAIVLVVVHNASINEYDAGIVAKVWTAITDGGWIGVQLFFVLSGYLITGILLDGRDDPKALRTFYIRRSLRIFPLYYLFLAIRLLILPLFVPSLVVGFGTQIWYWLYLSNWSERVLGEVHGLAHCWSLAVEEQFYLTWPFAARLLRPKAFAWLCGAIMIVAFAVRIALWAAGVDHTWLYAATVCRMDGLAVGALIAIALYVDLDAHLYARIRKAAAAAAGVGLVLVMSKSHGLSRYNPEVETIGYTLLAVLFGVVVAEVTLPAPSRWFAWLELRPLRSIGRYSYAMYIVHIPLRYTVQYYLADTLAAGEAAHPIATDIAWVIGIALGSYAIARVTYVAIERPLLALKDRWAPS